MWRYDFTCILWFVKFKSVSRNNSYVIPKPYFQAVIINDLETNSFSYIRSQMSEVSLTYNNIYILYMYYNNREKVGNSKNNIK